MAASNHQLTLRLPAELVESLRREARESGRSINELARAVLADFAERQRVRGAVEEIAANRQRMAARGLQPDSTPILRGLRDGAGRR